MTEAGKRLLEDAAKPFAANPELRQRLVDIHRSYEQTIDTVSADSLIKAGFSDEQAMRVVGSFRQYIEENRDEITALQTLYERPYRQRLSYDDIKALGDALVSPPRSWTTERLWEAYRQLDRSKVRGSGQRRLADIVSVVRYAIGGADELAPFAEGVRERFRGWLAMQETTGHAFHRGAGALAGGHTRPHRGQRQHHAGRLPVRPLQPTGRLGQGIRTVWGGVGRPARRAQPGTGSVARRA